MNQSIRWIFAASLLVPMTAAHAEEDSGWRTVLDADSLAEWEVVGDQGFVVDDGAVLTGDGRGLLWYPKERIGNAEIRVIFKTEKPGDNSGVFIRVDGPPKDPWFAVHRGYEVQIDNARDPWHSTGALYSLTKVKTQVDLSPKKWITMIIRLDGDRTVVTLDGTLVTDYKEGDPVPERKQWYEPKRGPRPNDGYIAIQNHDPESHVWFREIAVRPLNKKKQESKN